jgi:hypothetical protein
MLDGLDNIDWAGVRHFKGPATDVPKLLRDLISKDKKTQSLAIHELFGTIWRHGKVYEAAAKAVPFLYEILENPACSERFSVLWLLAAIANGDAHLQVHDPEKKSEVDQEMLWVENARGAVRQGMKTVFGFLGEEAQDLRLPAVLLLASFPEEAPQIKPVLSSVLIMEKKPEARAGLGLALALLGDFQSEAFRSENTKSSLLSMEALAKACVEDKGMKASAHRAIQDCLLATVGQEDQDWLRGEKKLLDSISLN